METPEKPKEVEPVKAIYPYRLDRIERFFNMPYDKLNFFMACILLALMLLRLLQ